MKSIFFSVVVASLFMGLLGCGNAERHNARQKFKEAVAAIKVRTQGATYSEFRQAELDLKTSQEVNKTYLDDVRAQFASLDTIMTATDYLWSESIRYPRFEFISMFGDKTVFQAIHVITPDTHIADKIDDYTPDQRRKDPDSYVMTYVHRGLTEISDQADGLLNLLEKQK
jgi:hypothetical protein